ncbi:hypothetical protein BH09SUM1_BH09SUM1_18840 [soil metagenome]
MPEIPHAVLSDRLQEHMSGRRLISAVFLTYKFDPEFFEREVLAVLFDLPLSMAAAIRLVQLEDAIRGLPGEIAVFYDADGLEIGKTSAQLDVRRIPVRHRTGAFHPKNVFLLVEDTEADEEGIHVRRLIVACMSANLTRAGWWESVEACHVEEIEVGQKTRLRDDLIWFLSGIRRRASFEKNHRAIDEVLKLLRTTEQRTNRSAEDQLHTHFYSGRESVLDFLAEVAGGRLRDACLEIISPYFDDREECQPLKDLIDRFQPREVRVFLPRSPSGEGLCNPQLYDAVRAMPCVQWGLLPKEFLRYGKSENATTRFVHAKIYRFFSRKPSREICFVGSVNLTTAAHQFGGNVECGFLIELAPEQRPEFWMTPDDKKPTHFQVQTDDETASGSGVTPLTLRYHWDRHRAEAFWDAPKASPPLRVESRGNTIGAIGPLGGRQGWAELTAEFTANLKEVLAETSIVYVHSEGHEPAPILVQEDGMSHKPSLLMQLSAADILRYWSMLTQEQRNAFLEERAPDISLLAEGADLVTSVRADAMHNTLFDRFAACFHAFGCLERAVKRALSEDKPREADYRLFGNKYDSLGKLLDKILSETATTDPVDQYVMVLCARQACREIARSYPEYWAAHNEDVTVLKAQFDRASAIRKRLEEKAPDSMPAFLEWFEPWFLKRASPVEVEA